MTDYDSIDESISVTSKPEAPSRVDSDASLSDVEDADGSASKPEKKQKIIFAFPDLTVEQNKREESEETGEI